MSLPALSKVWEFDTNNTVAAGGTILASYQNLMFTIKQILVSGFGTQSWTVVSSSNSLVANSSDNWNSVADIVFNTEGGIHSWIILKNTALGANWQILLNCANGAFGNANGDRGYFHCSPSGAFAGGTTSVSPSAGDQYKLQQTDYWSGSSASPFGFTAHGAKSTDGHCTRIFVCVGGAFTTGLIIDKMQFPIAELTNPVYAFTYANGAITSAITHTFLFNVANGRGRHSTTNMNLQLTVEAVGTSWLGTLAPYINEINSAYPLPPLGVYATTTGVRGRHGSLADIWMGTNAFGNVSGDTYPNDATRQFAQFGPLVIPWDGSVVVTS